MYKSIPIDFEVFWLQVVVVIVANKIEFIQAHFYQRSQNKFTFVELELWFSQLFIFSELELAKNGLTLTKLES